MADKNEIISRLLEGVPEGIKEIIIELQTLKSSFDSSQKSIADYLNKAYEGFEKMKKAANFAEFRRENAAYAASFKELTAVINAQQKTNEKILVLEKQLIDERKKNAKEIAEYQLQLKEAAKAQKESSNSTALAKKSAEDYGVTIEKGANSIKLLREENKELNKIVNELDIDTQAEDIARLNTIIEGNTATIKMNKDAYTQQKMDIGNYKLAAEGLGEKINLIIKLMEKERQATGEQSDEFKNLSVQLSALQKEQKEYSEGIRELSEENDNLKTKLSEVKNEMQNLALIGRENWSKDQEKQYQSLQQEAVKYQRAIDGVKRQTKELAENNLSMRGWNDALATTTATIQVAEKGLKDLGLSSKSYGEILVRVQSAQATLNSLEALSAKLRKNSTMMIALQQAAESKYIVTRKVATVAQWALNAAQKAMPFLAIAALGASIFSFFSNMSKSTDNAAESQKALNEHMNESIKKVTDIKNAFNTYITVCTIVKSTEAERADVLALLNKAMEDVGVQFKSHAEAIEWYAVNSATYTKAVEYQAKQEAHLNTVKDAQLKTDQLVAESETASAARKREISKELKTLSKTIKDSSYDAARFGGLYKSYMDAMGLSTTDIQKQAEKLAKELENWAKTDQQRLTEKYNEDKKMLETANKDTTNLTKKYYQDLENIRKAEADKQRAFLEMQQKIEIDLLQDGYEKSLKSLNIDKKKQLESVKGAKNEKQLIELIEKEHRKKIEDLNKEFTAKELNRQERELQNRLDIVERGSLEEYNLKMGLLHVLHKQERTEAEKLGLDLATIAEKYRILEDEAFNEYLDAETESELRAAEEQLKIHQEKLQAEETALLERYRSGEISYEKYQKELSDIRHKYNIAELKDEADAIEKIIAMASPEMQVELRQKLADLRKQISNAETSHELKNIKEINDARKKSAELAKELGKQTFDMAMDYLQQQSAARLEDIEAQIQDLDDWKNREFEKLSESVMSDETRAAETKRINEEAEAQRKKLEADKRKEQLKAFNFEKNKSMVQTLINTAQSIVKTGANLGYPAAIPFQVAAGVIGGAQLAMIATQQPPKYAQGIFGDESHPGGPAFVGDGGKHEYTLSPTGQIHKTPAIPTLVDLEKGTQVFPDYSSLMSFLRPEIPSYTSSSTQVPQFEEGIGRIEKAIMGIKPVQKVSLNLDANGIWYMANKGTGTQRRINHHFKR